jgi:nucleotidyltransferase/DNA polymerase involved in DNA repair
MLIACVIVPYFVTTDLRGGDKGTKERDVERTLDALLEHLMEVTPRVEIAGDRRPPERPRTADGRPPLLEKVAVGGLRSAVARSAVVVGHRPSSIIYLDLRDLDWPAAIATVQRIGQVVREQLRLSPAIGLARGKFTARVAAAVAEPGEALLIAPGHEAAFLAPFPVDLLPMDEETARRLRLLGIRTLGQLAALPAGAVLTQLGKEGRLLHRLAQGRDPAVSPVPGRCGTNRDRPVRPCRPTAVERVARPFDDPVANGTILEAVIRSMAQELATRLRARGYMGRTLTLILHLEDGTTCEERLVLRRPTAGAEHIAQTLCDLLARIRVPCGVVELEVTLTDLVPTTGQQLDLPLTGSGYGFVHQTGQEHRLREVLQDLVARYGADRFYRISLTDREARLPERRFRLLTAEGWGLKTGK